MARTALITGSSGGIGRALVKAFAQDGYDVVGLDLNPPADADAPFFQAADLSRFCEDQAYRQDVLAAIQARLAGRGLDVLINNAAYQVVEPFADLTPQAWTRSLNVNVSAPFMLTQLLFEPLKAARGCVINISSIHERLTKPGFVAYATSKAALTGLTRSLAVDIGEFVRVNAIAPAAIETDMLKAGFAARPDELRRLYDYHPTRKIGQPEEVAELALYMSSARSPFLNGAVVNLDGGIASRLHDPV